MPLLGAVRLSRCTFATFFPCSPLNPNSTGGGGGYSVHPLYFLPLGNEGYCNHNDHNVCPSVCLWSKACEHDNSSIFHPIFTKLGRIDDTWIETNPILWRYDGVITTFTVHWLQTKIPQFKLVNTITRSFFVISSYNLVGLMIYVKRRTLFYDVMMTSSLA